MFRTSLIVVTALSAFGTPALTVAAFPSDDTVRTLESQIAMPPEAKLLGEYDRYYFLAPSDHYPNQRVVEGTMLLRSSDIARPQDGKAVEGIAGAFTVDHVVPGPMDGGCAIVTVAFDLDTQKLIERRVGGPNQPLQNAVCNGDA